MHDVFISYKAEEFTEASWVKSVLEENGLICWMAPDSIPGGSSYADEIADAIAKCGVFVLILSQKAQESKWIKKEIDVALNEGKVILPFMIEDCQLQKAFNFYLTDVQRYDAYLSKANAMNEMIARINGILNRTTPVNQNHISEEEIQDTSSSELSKSLVVSEQIKSCDYSGDFVIEAGVLKAYKGSSVNVVVPDGVVEIGEYCFRNKNIKTVVISDSVKIINQAAFLDCLSLTSVKFGCNISFIGPVAFFRCSNLNSVRIITSPTSKTIIGKAAFFECSSLKSLEIGDGVAVIGESAFSSCDNLAFVKISSSVTDIGLGAFLNCKSLKSITLPTNIGNIGYKTFKGCSSLTSITIPDSVHSIGEQAFYGCTNLTSITIPKNVPGIGYAAFFDYWESKGLCRYCGGIFKGLLNKKCASCNKEKDY